MNLVMALYFWLKRELSWTRWIGNFDGEPVMFIKTLSKRLGCHIDLHKFVRADGAGCFHSHPAWAIRICLWGGYIEEVRIHEHDARGFELAMKCEDPGYIEVATIEGRQMFTGYWFSKRRIKPGHISVVDPRYVHRLHALINGRSSWSLWLRGPMVEPIYLLGLGWPPEMRGKAVTSGEDDLLRQTKEGA